MRHGDLTLDDKSFKKCRDFGFDFERENPPKVNDFGMKKVRS